MSHVTGPYHLVVDLASGRQVHRVLYDRAVGEAAVCAARPTRSYEGYRSIRDIALYGYVATSAVLDLFANAPTRPMWMRLI